MANAKFVLKEPKGKEETLIFLFYRFQSNKLKYSTGQKIKPKYWNPVKQRAKISREFPQATKLNELLDNLSHGVADAYKDQINKRKAPAAHTLKDEMNKVLFKEEYAHKTGFLKFVEDLISHSNRKPNTLKQWRQTLRKLTEFKASSQTVVDYDTINLDFYNRFIQSLTKEGYTNNTIGCFIKNLKIFMNEAVERN